VGVVGGLRRLVISAAKATSLHLLTLWSFGNAVEGALQGCSVGTKGLL
jgi:hypothetical protein